MEDRTLLGILCWLEIGWLRQSSRVERGLMRDRDVRVAGSGG
jgi:hypothetical protein